MKPYRQKLVADFENGEVGLDFESLGAALEYAHQKKTRITRTY